MTVTVERRALARMQWLAAALGIAAVLGEAFIAIATLVSGYWFGFYDVVGVALGIAALVLVWKHPVGASLLWLGEEAMLYNGHLLVSIACLPILLLQLSAAALALASWFRSRPASVR